MMIIEYPITVPDDVPIMDDTQFLNYVRRHVCDEVYRIIEDAVLKDDETPAGILKNAINNAISNLQSIAAEIDSVNSDLSEAMSEVV